jgi:hypothetical protein
MTREAGNGAQQMTDFPSSPVTERDAALVRDLALAFAAGKYEGGETLFDMYANIALKFMETRGLAQTPAVRLEARPADDSQPWTEIFPVQLQWVAKQGHQVRAIELADTSTDRPEEITKAEMDVIEAAAIAGKPLTGNHDREDK